MTIARAQFLESALLREQPWLVRKRTILRGFPAATKIIYFTGALRTYSVAGEICFVWRWWHPVSWVGLAAAIPLSIVARCKVSDVVNIDVKEFRGRSEDRMDVDWI